MSKKFGILAAVVALGITTAAMATDEVILVAPAAPLHQTAYAAAPQATLQPVPATLQPVPVAMQPVPFQDAAPLFTNVKVRDEKRIACNSVPMIVTVKDPCVCKDRCACKDACSCTPPKCVNIQICVPGCTECPPKVTCKKDGAYVKYDFGKYRVEIRSKKGYVEVDYD